MVGGGDRDNLYGRARLLSPKRHKSSSRLCFFFINPPFFPCYVYVFCASSIKQQKTKICDSLRTASILTERESRNK